MTFQVAMIGSDGLIVGSDRRIGVRTPRADTSGAGIVQFMAGPKFIKRDGVVCFAAGGPQAQSIAAAIIEKAEPKQSDAAWQLSVETIADGIRAQSVGDEVLVIRDSKPDHVILVSRTGTTTAACRIEQRVCTGVPLTARFVAQHLWEYAPVSTLKKLVLLVLDYASRERPTEVGCGFDLMILEAGVIRFESYAPDDSRIRVLRVGFQTSVRSWLSSTAP